VADALNVKPETIKHWIDERRLRAIKIGRAYRISPTEVRRLLDLDEAA